MNGTGEEVVLGFFNAQSLSPKEEIVKEELLKKGVTQCSFCETRVYKSAGFSDKTWVWDVGPGVARPHPQSPGKRYGYPHGPGT